MSSETPVTAADASPAVDAVMAPAPAEETSAAAEVTKEDDKPSEDAEPKDEKEKEVKAPSRRSTRISSKPQTETNEAPKPKRAPSTRKRTIDEGNDDGKSSKKVKSDSFDSGPAIGSFLPEITLKSEKDTDVDVSLLAKEKGVVLFLVPKADTPGCTTQACAFRDVYADFTSAEYDVYCVSADSPAAQTKWQDKKSLPYGLLSDPDRKLISALGANDKGKTKRSHFVFAKAEQDAQGKGKLIDKKLGVKPAESPKLAMEFIKSYAPSATNGEATSSETNGASSSSTNGTAAAPTEVVAEAEAEVEAAPASNGTTEDVTMETA